MAVKQEDPYAALLVGRIRTLCKQRGFTIYRLAVMSGLRHSTLDNIVNFRISNPRIKTLHRIAAAFSMTLAEFLDFPELDAYSLDDEPDEAEP